MKYRLLFFALLLTGLACQAQNQIDKQGRKQGHWVKTDKNGVKVYEGDFVDDMETGTFTYYYEDGKVRIKNVYTVPGKICNHEVFDPAGRIMAKGTFNQKNRDGRWEFYTTAGDVIKITNYKMGVRHGLQVIFTSAGDTAEVCNWTDNHRNGRWWKRIGKQGYITATYKMGLIEGRLVEYDDNNQLVREGYYKEGERDGHYKYYEENKLTVDETYQKGDLKDRKVRLLLPEERFVSIYDIYYMVPQGKNKVIIYLADGSRLTDLERAEQLYRHVGDSRFTLANKEARIMIATNLIVGTTHDREGRLVLNLDPKPDFDIFPDDDCMRMLRSLDLQKQTLDAGGVFDFEK